MDSPKARYNLFTVLEQGDRRIQNMKEKAIILVGGTRIGKSTLFNLILNKRMIGQKKGRNVSYCLMTDQQGQAKMSSSYKSETLAPNAKPNFTEDVTLLDMAGFGDTRDYIGIIGVSYFLKKVTQKVKQFKFVLVIDQSGMKDPTGQKLIQTFQGFINMFRFDLMTPEIKDQLKNSLSFVVTRSTMDNYHDDIQNAIEQLKDEQFQVDNRELIIQLMRSVGFSNRIEGFKAAKENMNSTEEETKFIDRFDKVLNWQFFNLKEAEQTIEQSLVSLPFSKEYEIMTEKDKISVSAAMTSKTESYKEVQLIFNILLKFFKKNWDNVIEKWEKTGEFVPNFFQMKEPFDEIAKFLDKYDFYNSQKTITTNFRSSYDPPSLISAVNTIRTAYKETEKISAHDDVGNVKQKILDISVVYANLMNIFKPFCTCEEDQVLVARLHYVIQRGLIECSSLYDLRQVLVHGVVYFLTDAIENAFEMSLKDFLEIFFKKINSDLTSVMLNSFDAIEEYDGLFRLYEQQFKEVQEDKLLIPKQKCSIDAARADLCLRAGQKSKATISLSKVIKTLEEISLHVIDSNEQTQIKCAQLKTLQMDKRKMVLKMVNILTELPKTEVFEPLCFAIELCKHMNFTKDAREIYEKIIDSSKTPLDHKSQMCLDYFNYLIYWGLLDKALQVLETKQSIETQDFDRYEETLILISEFEDKRETYRQEFRSRSKLWRREPMRDEKLLQILSDIELVLPKDQLSPAK